MSEDEARLIEMATVRGDFAQLEDGYVYYFPAHDGGALGSWMLRTLARELDRRNAAWDAQIQRDVGRRELPVHCCCDPQNRLGYLDVSGMTVPLTQGARVAFGLRSGGVVTLEADLLTRYDHNRMAKPVSILAFKSGDTPIETLRQLNGWREEMTGIEDVYLGDAVYASFDGYQIWLRLNDHRSPGLIALDPHVMSALKQYADRIWPATVVEANGE